LDSESQVETSLGITVEAVNDPPVISNTHTTLAIDEDSVLLIQGLGLIDVDARQGTGTASVSASHGTVQLLPGSIGAVVGAGMCAVVNGSHALECSGGFAALNQVRTDWFGWWLGC
jgi:hypothetical protein